MSITIKDLQDALHTAFSHTSRPSKIKITSKADSILNSPCGPIFKVLSREEYVETYRDMPNRVGYWDAIPIEIDDTIDNEYYEFVYEEEFNNVQT